MLDARPGPGRGLEDMGQTKEATARQDGAARKSVACLLPVQNVNNGNRCSCRFGEKPAKCSKR